MRTLPEYKKLWIGLGCLVAFIIIVLIIVSSLTSKQIAVINDQLAAIRAGDIQKAYSYTSMDFRGATSLGEFEDFVSHYPALKNNKNGKFTEKEVKNDAAVIDGTLYGKDGNSTPVEYLLIKEQGQWRIMGIQAYPGGNTEANENTSANHYSLAESTTLSNTYDNTDSRYTMGYPTSWGYEKVGDGTIIFSGKRGTPAFFSTINIQTVLTKTNGGDFSTVKQFMTDIKHQAVSQSPNVKFFENGPIVVTEKNGAKDKGEYTIFSYSYKGKEFKQWQIVVLRSDGQVFYAWAYTSPTSQYPNDLTVAKHMLESWVIY